MGCEVEEIMTVTLEFSKVELERVKRLKKRCNRSSIENTLKRAVRLAELYYDHLDEVKRDFRGRRAKEV